MAAGHTDMPLAAAVRGVFQLTPDGCVAACVASILRVDIERVPRVDHGAGALWLDRYNVELRAALRFELVCLTPSPPFAGLWIAEVASKNHDAPGGHAVVMHGPDLLWDPSKGERYETVAMDEVRGAYFLLPLYPGHGSTRLREALQYIAGEQPSAANCHRVARATLAASAKSGGSDT